MSLAVPTVPVVRSPNFLQTLFTGNLAVTAAGVVIMIMVLVAIFAPFLAPMDPLTQSVFKINQYPSMEHWLGTDQFGRDVLSRLIFGSRNSLIVGLVSPVIAAVIGTILGVVAGYYGGIVDRLLTRLNDAMLSFPELLLAIMIASVLGGGFWNVVGVIAVAFIPGFARVARASTLSVVQEPYVEAAVAVGLSSPRIIIRHVLPNIAAPIMVLLTLWVASAIRLEASLSFLGLGTQPPAASWGNIIRDALSNIFGSPWPIIGAGLLITVVVLSFNVMGDALRDALDPETQS
ncbi:ABC transporter permease [Devosia epidermidihirudinis]|uniref:ABC transporter permease n=1 Tax=Devosia epidermidihirudinis TaxID=1293439 RepID=UPI000698E338|nr:ABC transporter permease [Devosia epidermidihirudinis]